MNAGRKPPIRETSYKPGYSERRPRASLRSLVVTIEPFARVNARFASINALLKSCGDLRGNGIRVFRAWVEHHDVIRRGKAHDIQDAERTQGCARAQHPRFVDGLRIGNAGCVQCLSGVQERHEHAVQDIAGLLLVQLQRNHAQVSGETNHLVVSSLIGSRMAHDLGSVVTPDAIGEMQRQELLGATRRCRDLARQQRGGVGDENGAFGQVLCQLRVERVLLLGILRNCLDHQVGILRRILIAGGEDDALERLLRALLKLLDFVNGKLGRVGQTTTIRRRVALHRLKRCQIGLTQLLELRLRALDGPFAAQPHRNVKALVCRLICNLASQHTATGNDNVLDSHIRPPICAMFNLLMARDRIGAPRHKPSTLLGSRNNLPRKRWQFVAIGL